jgi:uncharacterized protein YndB with AHSA1/START domain
MLKAIALLLFVAIAGVLGYAATRPDDFRVQRSINIQAPPENVFAILNDLHNFPSWSPYEKLDPAMKKTHSGTAQGLGAVYAWEGNSEVGKGRMEIIESRPPNNLKIKLDFLEPFTAQNTAEYTLAPNGGATRMTWAMYGPQPLPAKVMGLFVDMDKMIGGQFEEGLAKLKALVEKPGS